MLPQYNDTQYAELRKEAKGTAGDYDRKVDWLKAKWTKTDTIADETTGRRLVGPLLNSGAPPLDIALISDNLAAFKKHYQIYISILKPTQLLEQACLCGSKAVAEYLLNELKLSYLSEGQEYLLTYVAASPNVEWAVELAKHFTEANKGLPPLLSIFASPEMESTIKNIFSNKGNITNISAKV